MVGPWFTTPWRLASQSHGAVALRFRPPIPSLVPPFFLAWRSPAQNTQSMLNLGGSSKDSRCIYMKPMVTGHFWGAEHCPVAPEASKMLYLDSCSYSAFVCSLIVLHSSFCAGCQRV